ncbi:MAG: ABC transporter ATP-binding protein [Thermohalobaculum sp.]|nr:ABC transporter ATP-binding protein [Thermohalobaculum sp.]
MTHLLEIRNLTVSFATASGSFTAVENVDITVDDGEILAIVGESGSGKSVSMMAVMGLLPWTATVTADRMAFRGQDLLTMTPRRRRQIYGREMAMIFQEPMSSLNPCFTVGAQIDEAIRTHLGGSRAERRARTLDLLAQVGIPDPKSRLGAYPHQLSGGMSQRVMIAMALSCDPALLIADEPTTALDVTIQAQILDLLRDLQSQRGMGLILITHDMGVVAEMAHRVAVQYAGWRVETQPVRDLFARPHHPYTEALLDALPDRAVKGQLLPTIPGVVPGQFDRPPGCLFAPRCRYAGPDCDAGAPPPYPGDPAEARCVRPLHRAPAEHTT